MKRIRKKILVTTLLFLSASAAHSDQILNNLLESSQSIVDSLHAGYQVTGGLAAMASSGTGVAQMGVVAESGALITGDQVSAYNNAVQAMADAEYYTAQNFFLDESEKALERMETAIEKFSEAATELVITTQEAERAEAAIESGDSQAAQEVQDFVEANENILVVDQETVDEYNSSLEDIEVESSTAAIWAAAANSESTVAWANEIAEAGEKSFTDVSTSYFSRQSGLAAVYWDNVAFAITAENLGVWANTTDVLLAGADSDFFENGPAGKSYECFVYGTDCE